MSSDGPGVRSEDTYRLYRRGVELLEDGNFGEATVPLAEAARRAPEKSSVREALGRAYFRNHQFAEAATEFEAVVESHPVNDFAHFCLGRALSLIGHAERARHHLALASNLQPQRRDYRIYRDRARRAAQLGAWHPRMRAVVQRVKRASVSAEGEQLAAIGPGLLVLLGVGAGDGPGEAAQLAAKVVKLRVFDDAQGRMNEPLGPRELLCVSQFTLYGDVRKGNRPSYTAAAPPELAEPLYERFCELTGAKRGRFGARMAVESVNDGPATLLLEA